MNYQHNWKSTLRNLELKFNSWTKMDNVSTAEGLVDVNEIMKKHYPGNYDVIEAFLPERGVFGFKLVFQTPQDETLFLLRWS